MPDSESVLLNDRPRTPWNKKATLIYRRMGNLRAVQLLLGHTKIENTVRYLGIEVDDALANK
jgi:site-specific recombinase XerC